MSLWSRVKNVFSGDRLRSDIDEELESHFAEAIEHGRTPEEVRAAFGSPLRHREWSSDVRMLGWLDSLRADVIFGWRQIRKNSGISVAAILSLALAIGACTSAFRLVDAMLLRPLPVAHADRLYLVSRAGIGPAGDFRVSDANEYPLFERMRAAMKGQAELMAASYSERADITFGSDEDMERVNLQYVSGWMFPTFAIRPASGRLFSENDDRTPGGHPYAVLSYDYWTRRFNRDAAIIGRTFRLGNALYQVIGVAGERFTGTEPGTFIDVFLPTKMNPWVQRSDASWFRTLAVLADGVAPETVQAKLQPVLRRFQEERAKTWKTASPHFIERFLNQTIVMEPGASGMSGMTRQYTRPLLVLSILAGMVLLIACANIANLMMAQAAARSREMALRVSIGAGRLRLVQLVLVESAIIGVIAACLGNLFAWWSAPFVVARINPPDNPVRLSLPWDWRAIAFGAAVTVAVTCIFGLLPALRASAMKPATALRGDDPHSRRRLMHALISAQVAFCFVIELSAALFVSSFDHLANQPTGFAPEGLLNLETVSRQPQPPAAWDDELQHLRSLPGVKSAAISGFPLLSGNGWSGFIWTNGNPTGVLAYFFAVSPGWVDTMGIKWSGGRDIRHGETSPGVAIVNRAFVEQCLGGTNPLGRWFEKETGDGMTKDRYQVVGVVENARYRNMREPLTPTAYVPFLSVGRSGTTQAKDEGTFVVRVAGGNALALAASLRREVGKVRSEFRVSNVSTQQELDRKHTLRERLLSMVAVFFASIALLLAGIGLYGVLDYSVLQRRREIGIRVAIGAPISSIAAKVAGESLVMVVVGGAAGLISGLVCARYVSTLLYQVKPTDIGVLAVPSVVVFVTAVISTLPPLVRAIRVDPVTLLRVE